jgi:diguanylate cyclase (GGDEF)-like protein/PAS domain S-box-containing protein
MRGTVLRPSAASFAHLRLVRRPGRSYALRVAGCFLTSVLATVFVGLEVESNLIWVANGVLLSYLLLAPRWRWPAYISAGFLGQLVGTLIVSGTHTKPMFLALGPLNVAEAALAAFLLRRRSAVLPRFTDGAYLLRFFGLGVVLAPAITALAFAAGRGFWHNSTLPHAFLDWIGTDSLGMVVAAPACVAILRMRLKETRNAGWNLLLPVCLAGVALLAFQHMQAPLMSIVFPILILILLRLGMGWASVSLLLVAGIGNWFLAHSMTHIQAGQSFNPLDPSVQLQVFVVSGIFMLYSISVVMESRRRAEKRLAHVASLHELVTSSSRDIILLADLNGIPKYISQAVLSITGWKPEETMHRGFCEVVHPEDLPRMEELMSRISGGLDTAVIEYRVSRRTGGYVWVEGSFHSVLDPRLGIRTGILQIVRDISERKAAEERLQAAYRVLEGMAAVDALTGLANRRRFDELFAREWRRGLRDSKPLSIVLLDVDLFKLYNDSYGHLRGDSCLKQVAESAMDVVTRAGDSVARYGGEEFAIILPNTGEAGALGVAQEVADSLRARGLRHESSPHRVVTVSAGCATLIPQPDCTADALIEAADRALYRAKRSGRNRVCTAEPDCWEPKTSANEPWIVNSGQ